jgi:peptide/nickel transport system ATP-binding protein
MSDTASVTKTTKNGELLGIDNLSVSFHTRRGEVKAVRNLNLNIREGETLALVGESGCGKSVTAHAITRLIPMPPGVIESGIIRFRGTELLSLSEKEMRALRGSKISIKDAFAKAVELLDLVKIPDPGKRAKSYPHQLSGGMRQRAMIAMALASPDPGLMIADEPTTALDVTIQAQILQLLSELKERVGMALLLITHDMGVVAETADRVAVMYAGRKVEDAPVEELFANPRHPYTAGLLGCQCSAPSNRGAFRLTSIGGSVPDLLTLGEGCPFANRCENVKPECLEVFPEITMAGENHEFRCHNPITPSGAPE